MKEEIFGPILPVIKVADFKQAINIMHVHENPLALYLFGKNRARFDE
jgi:aldehyde dehydrogenase (NAD+)